MSELRRIIIAMNEFDALDEIDTLGDLLWEVPARDEDNRTFVGWHQDNGGYYLRTQAPENEDFNSSYYPSLPLLMVGTFGGVRWDEIDEELKAELKDAPLAVFGDVAHHDRREIEVAKILGLAS